MTQSLMKSLMLVGAALDMMSSTSLVAENVMRLTYFFLRPEFSLAPPQEPFVVICLIILKMFCDMRKIS